MQNAGMSTATINQDMDTLASVWEEIKGRLKAIYGEATFKSWMEALTFETASGAQVTLSVPSRFTRDWIANHYLRKIESLWRDEAKHIFRVELVVRKKAALSNISKTENLTDKEVKIANGTDITGQNIAKIDEVIAEDEPLSAKLDRRFTFNNFVVGKSNELAYAAAKAVAESEKTVVGSNPLFIYGGVGLGKTHLMHAIAWHIKENTPARRVVYLSAEKFMYQFIRALRNKDVLSFKEQLRSIDVLMIDDVQFICGKDSTQEEFFHTFNALIDQGKQLIISGDRSPSDLESMEERVRSRLGWGLVTDINTTTYELRLGILQSKAAQMPYVSIPNEALELMASKITSNIRELEGSLNKVVAQATLMQKEITIASVQETLSDILRASGKSITIDDIQRTVADYYQIRLSDMTSARRLKAIARPRQVAMYLAKNLTSRSLSEIGRRFGKKDHTTIIHAVKRIEALMESDTELATDMDRIKKSLV